MPNRRQAITWSNADPVHWRIYGTKGRWVSNITDWLSNPLTHCGRVMHICVSKLTIIASDNGLSPARHQAIIWTSAGILLIGPLGTNFSEIWIEIITFSFKKMRLKVSSAKWQPFCLGLNVLTLNKMVATDRWYFHNHLKKSVRERTVPFFYIHFSLLYDGTVDNQYWFR